MLDAKLIRTNPDYIKSKLSDRGIKEQLIDELIDKDKCRRDLIVKSETLKKYRNDVSDQIALKKRDKEDAFDLISEMKKTSLNIKELVSELDDIEQEFQDKLAHLPNLTHETVPVGTDESYNKEIERHGKLPEFNFDPMAHWDLGEKLHILDFERAAKVSGSRFVYYVGLGAQLERALHNFFLDENVKAGFTEEIPPFLVNDASMFGTGQFPKFKENKAGYEIKDEDMNLIPTAEVPLVNFYRDEILNESQLPIKVTALSPAFRSEAGGAGRDTRGLIRMHQFNKVEIVQLTKPADSGEALKDMVVHVEKLLNKLGLPYRKILLSTGDMSFTSSMTYDLEVWMPYQKKYREISSCSNCTDFQARRAKIRYRDSDGKISYVHTLNASSLAVGRTFASIIENYQNDDGSITIPKALVSYMNGLETIK